MNKLPKDPNEKYWHNDKGDLLYIREDVDSRDGHYGEICTVATYYARDAYTGEEVELDDVDTDAVRELFEAGRPWWTKP